MPTENRSSNTEMVSVPRDLADRIQQRLDLAASAFKAAKSERDQFRALLAQPAPQPHPEPIAWMVGTAFWWTKEEAARDAAETGLPIVGLGPMTGVAPVEQHQGKPVGEVVAFGKGLHEIAWAAGRMPKLGAKLYTHADPGEVERLRNELDEWKKRCQYNADTAHDVAHERDTLRAEADRLRQEVASIDKKLRGNVSDPDPLKPIMPGALSITTTYGLVAGIVRERDQLKKALERQP